jgi:SNF family Na+-dependent transporter
MIRPSGGQPPAGLSAARGLAALWAYLGFLNYYLLVILIFNAVPLIMEFTIGSRQPPTGHQASRTVAAHMHKVSATVRQTMLRNNINN